MRRTLAVIVPTLLLVAGASGGEWPVLQRYDGQHLAKIALPLGGIGTGTVSLGGRGNLKDWEIMNRPAKGFNPGQNFKRSPFFSLYVRVPGHQAVTRLLEGPMDLSEYEGASGVERATNHGLPRFRECSFDAAYPLGQVHLADRALPVKILLQAFNPLVPCDDEASGIPIAVLRYVITNTTNQELTAAICGSMQNFIGRDGSRGEPRGNRNEYRSERSMRGIFMFSSGVDSTSEQWGTMALATPASEGVTFRTGWIPEQWGSATLDFWDDFSDDGALDERSSSNIDAPMGSLAVKTTLPPHGTRELVFIISWHFPNRIAWASERIGNYYTTKYRDAWDVSRQIIPDLPRLENETVEFVRTFCSSNLPREVKEAALFNLTALRTQTSFRTSDGNFYGWEGCGDTEGCCMGSCTHVWNYEQATPFLFGNLAKLMRRVEFGFATAKSGLMSFRVQLPLAKAQQWSRGAADGQMGSIMKMYRDWQLSGDSAFLRVLWPNVKKALAFCWIPGGWDSNRDGVMDGCQHNTMDVEYFGPNGQMQLWYLGALRAAEEMARAMGDREFSELCHFLFEDGQQWTDRHLFNGEYYEQIVQPPMERSRIARGLLVGGGAKDLTAPDYQLGKACLVDQLVGQYMAHICNLGYLVSPDHVQSTLRSIMKYNYRASMFDHFNCLRSFATGDESALLMASYPYGRPKNPFPYFTEVMTGFEYTAAVGMLYEGQREPGLTCIRNIRDRYDGRKRSPFDEAECGHHYARAMASWAGVLALTGFHFSAPAKEMMVNTIDGQTFWSTGYAYGTLTQDGTKGKEKKVRLKVLNGTITLQTLTLNGFGKVSLDKPRSLRKGDLVDLLVISRVSTHKPPSPRLVDGYIPHFVHTPSITPGDTISLDSAIVVSLTTTTEGATIRYTLDGSEPSNTSPAYGAPLSLHESAEVRAIAMKEGMRNSYLAQAQFRFVNSKKNGLTYKYYEGTWQKLPDFKSLNPVSTGVVYNIGLDGMQKRDDFFGLDFLGYVRIPRDGVYTIFVNSDDGSRLFLDSALVVDNDSAHSAIEKKGTLTLKEGLHSVEIQYFEFTGAESLDISIEGPGMEKQPIPPDLIFRSRTE